MTFTFNNYAEKSRQPPDLIQALLNSYSGATKARYLKPSLEEELLKARQYNKYYGPNMESQMGLRGAQASHLGAQTQGLNIHNKYLPQQLQEQMKAAQFKNENPFFGQKGTAGDIGNYLFLKQHPELASLLESQQTNSAEIPNQGIQYNQQQGIYNPLSANAQNFGGQQTPVNAYISSLLGAQNNNMQSSDQMPSQGMGVMQQPMSSEFNQPNQAPNKPMNFMDRLQEQLLNAQANKGKPTDVLKNLAALSQAQEGINPTTNRPFRNNQEQQAYLNTLRDHLAGTKKGERTIYDPQTNEAIGRARPYSPKERDIYYGRENFKILFPVIQKGFNPYSGKGSGTQFTKDAYNYGTDPAATQRIDDLLLADKTLAAGVVNEAGTLNAGRTNQTFTRLESGLNSSDIPKFIKVGIKKFALPPEAYTKANQRFMDLAINATETASKNVPAEKIEYFEPEKYIKSHPAKGLEGKEKKKEANKSTKTKFFNVYDPNTGRDEIMTQEAIDRFNKGK